MIMTFMHAFMAVLGAMLAWALASLITFAGGLWLFCLVIGLDPIKLIGDMRDAFAILAY